MSTPNLQLPTPKSIRVDQLRVPLGVGSWKLGVDVTQSAYLFLGLTAVVAALVGLLAFAAAKFFTAARAATQSGRVEGAETAFMASAMEEARTQAPE